MINLHVSDILECISDIVIDAHLDSQSDLRITGITDKSNDVKPGYLFFCRKGSQFDSHEIAPEIVKKGAVLLITERFLQIDAPMVVVSDSRLAEALIAKNFFQNPSEDLTVIGVTGTNGKTTCSHLFHHILSKFGSTGSLLGTVFYEILGVSRFHHDNTTPGAIEIMSAMQRTKQNCGEYFIMEVSSHSLAMNRVEGVRFDIAALTNITRDHLDFHSCFEEYSRIKLHIFDLLKDNGIAVISDEFEHLLQKRVNKIVYGTSRKCHYRIEDVDVNKVRTDFTIETPQGTFQACIPIPGIHNAYNAALVIASLAEMGYSPRDIIEALRSFNGVEGRFEYVKEASLVGFDVVVDFAHTPDALEKTLVTAKHLTTGRLITVFGAGGMADKGKRPLMAEVASKLSDVVIITTDDPRGEDVDEILSQVESGVIPDTPYLVLRDRYEAIETALTLANRGDMVLVAGRGHEEYQIFSKEKKIPFKDSEIIRSIVYREYAKEMKK